MAIMVTYDEYVKGLLEQILESHKTLSELKDKPGDLDIIKKEYLKIYGLIQAMINKVESSGKTTDYYVEILKRSNYYLENYDFQREMDIMAPLYSDDSDRLKHLRLKILESFEDKKFVEKINHIKDEL